MSCAESIEQAVMMAEQRWPGYEFRIKNTEEACGPCPICGEADEDGFIIFFTGYAMCRPGHHHLWIDDDQERSWTKEEIRLRRIEASAARAARERQDIAQRLSALERLNASQIHLRYHHNLDDQSREWWSAKGCTPETVTDYQLGYCRRCPTDKERRASYTIPLWDNERRTLWNVRHRLANASNGDKYRPEMAGLGACLAFPHHLIDADYGLIVEGSVKSIIIHQHGFPAVGVMGKRGVFRVEWLEWFPNGPIYIALDPDAQESAERLGHGLAKIGKKAYVASFPCKPDDWFIDGGNAYDFYKYLQYGKRIH